MYPGRARPHDQAAVAWLPLNFIFYLLLCSMMLPRGTAYGHTPHLMAGAVGALCSQFQHRDLGLGPYPSCL